jgi:hypothetical protein
MRTSEAPRPGWYPDPQGGARLRWWDGTDWTDRYRPPPTPAELERTSRSAKGARAPDAPDRPKAGIARAEVDEIVAHVRQVARSELDRAADVFTQRASAATREFRPLVTEYTNRLLRWVRIGAIVVAVALVGWFVFQAFAQVTFFEWLGDRIDGLTD